MTTTGVAGEWGRELRDLVRGASGGLLFGIPLLYTMEVWWTGSRTEPAQVLAVLVLTFVPVVVLNRTAGFRDTRDLRWRDAATDAVEALALGLVLAALLLSLLRQIEPGVPAKVAVGKVVYEALPFSIGIALAHHLLREVDDGTTDGSIGKRTGRRASSAGRDGDVAVAASLADLGATTIGSVFVALSVAPTDEVPMLTAAMGPWWTLLLVAASLVVCYGIVFVAGFAGQQRRRSQRGIAQHPVTETMASYLVALAVSAALLWAFQRSGGSWEHDLRQVVVLGLPAAVGGAAGRLAV